MLLRSILAVLLYVCGLVALVIWSVHGFVTGAPKDEWALMIVLPLAWTISYWPLLGALLMIDRICGSRRTIAGMEAEIEAGTDLSPEKLKELEDFGTSYAARENHLPEFIVRPLVRKGLNRLAKAGALKRIIDKGREQPDA